MRVPLRAGFTTKFDSSWGMLMATARFLHGRDFPGVGILPNFRLAEIVLSSLGERVVTTVYAYEGAMEALRPEALWAIRAEKVSRLIVREYPKRRYPAVAIGSANGAIVHLCAALGIPWLPQTFLISVHHPKIDVDRPVAYMEWARQPAQQIVAANPDLVIHQKHDPAQDRLMSQKMAYFRIKRTRLGNTLESFVRESLAPGGTIFLVECQLGWPVKQVGERHFFQTGGVGGLTPDEYLTCNAKVESFLKQESASRLCWDAPAPDTVRPEAEWGFEPELREDVIAFATKNGYAVKRIVFTDPEDMSALVADLYRWWYSERQIPADNLLVECFNILESWWTLRTGSVPFWVVFNMEGSASSLERYVTTTTPYQSIYVMLFSHGVKGPGLASVERWRSIMKHAKSGTFIGFDEQKYPKDMSVFVRYNREIRQKIKERYPMPEPLPLEQLSHFIKESASRFRVEWL
jgi:hypothetical protein